MSDSEPLLDRAAIADILRKLGDRLVRRGVSADIYVVGGAAMALAYDARRATRDIDAVFEPHGIVLEEVRALARELALPQWWLNERRASTLLREGTPPLLVSSTIRASGLGRIAPTSSRNEDACWPQA